MSERDESSTSASQSEDDTNEEEEETNGEEEEEEEVDNNNGGHLVEKKATEQEGEMDNNKPSFPSLSSLRAVLRIKQKYVAMKKRRQELSLGFGGGCHGAFTGAPSRTSPKIFTFDGLTPSALSNTRSNNPGSGNSCNTQKKKKRRRRRVLFPNGTRRRCPPKPAPSRAKYCLYLLLAILFMQVYNAIENLDDHVLRYDLDGLDKSLRREVLGQQPAVDALLASLREFLSTYVHNKPLVLSIHGPSGVGKSHLGRLLAGHFRSVVGEPLVLQYYVLHHCPQGGDALQCAQNLSQSISGMVQRAEEEEKIPLFVFDEAEHMHTEILDMLNLLAANSKQPNEYMNAIYLFLSNLGQGHIVKHMLHNSSSLSSGSGSGRHGNNLVKVLGPVLRGALAEVHPLWADAELLPLGLLEKSHVMECFLDEMSREGFYPDHGHIERLAGEMEYYPEEGGRQYARTGCKQVVAKVNLL